MLHHIFALFLLASQMLFADIWLSPKEATFVKSIGNTINSPPREYFSLNAIYLEDGQLIQVGHDIVNNTYVILPSPNLIHLIERDNGEKVATFRLYFPEAAKAVMKHFRLRANQVHYLMISSLEIVDETGNSIESVSIPGAFYRPPDVMEVDIPAGSKISTFVYDFIGRAAWSQSGISTDVRALYQDLSALDYNRDARIYFKAHAETGMEAMEVFSLKEDQKLNRVLSEFRSVVAWGDLAAKPELLQSISKLMESQVVSIDLAGDLDDLGKYKSLFGDPPDGKFTSALKKIRSKKLTEKEAKSEGSSSGKFGLEGVFSLGGSGSSKSEERLKDFVEFEAEGEFYIPKALNFVLRTQNQLELLKGLLFQAYTDLKEVNYRFATGVSLIMQGVAQELRILPLPFTGAVNSYRQRASHKCHQGSALSGVMSHHHNSQEDRQFRYQCSEIKLDNEVTEFGRCSSVANVNHYDTPVVFSCGGNQVLVSEKSTWHHRYEDRQFSYGCCEIVNRKLDSLRKSACHWSGWVNSYDTPVSFQCPTGEVLNGVSSTHNNKAEDRIYKYECCQLSQKED